MCSRARRGRGGYGSDSGLPAALVGGAALASLATAIGPHAQIEITPSWRERAILWTALVAPRGAGKSPSQDLAFRPLRDHDAQLTDDDDGGELLLGDCTLEALARSLKASGGAGALDLDELHVLLKGLGEYKRGGGGDRGGFWPCGAAHLGRTRASALAARTGTRSSCESRGPWW
jgi:hypothetical protein